MFDNVVLLDTEARLLVSVLRGFPSLPSLAFPMREKQLVGWLITQFLTMDYSITQTGRAMGRLH